MHWLQRYSFLWRFVPEVTPPGSKMLTFRERATWTAITLVIYLMCCQIPIYGIRVSEYADPLQWLRQMIASQRGTLMELGITPIVTSGMMLQLLSGTHAIFIDPSDAELQKLFQGFEKFCSLVLTLLYAVGYTMSGMYGDVGNLGTGNCLLIILQLAVAGVLVLLLDEMLKKGYGIGGGISLFIATNVCESIIWKTFSPTTYNMGKGPEFEGCLIACLHLLITRPDKLQALREAFYRQNLPNLTNLMATIIVFAVVVYFQGFRVDLPLKNIQSRGMQGNKLPIKLFYTSNIPMILCSALVSHMYTLSQILSRRFPGNLFFRYIGDWRPNQYNRWIPVGGLAYYLSPPQNFTEFVTDPIHALVYVVFILCSCALFSRIWIDISGSSPTDVARNLKNQNLVIKGYSSDACLKVLNRYIPVAAMFGGMCIGALSIFADMLGALGRGTGILLAVSIISGYIDQYSRNATWNSGLFGGMDQLLM